MPSHVKTYDGSEDPEDHLKIFQAAAKVESWAMPTWCHMFNSTLTGSARVWFDDLPPESVESYDDLKEAFLENFRQQKKCIKDPVKIHHIKQREGDLMCFYGESDFFRSWFPAANSPLRKDVVIFIILSTDFGILSCKHLISSGFVIPYMNPEILMTSVRSSSPYNGIIERPGVRKIQAVPSTAHGMLKFSVAGGILTLKSSKIIPIECAAVSGPEGQPPATHQAIKERIKAYSETSVEHTGRMSSGQAKEERSSGRQDPDFKDLKKACPKDGYPLPEIDWKVESLCEFPFKCFLDAYKGYHQIKMAKEDKEKTTFITSKGIFCYSKIPFGLRNAGATYQRLVDKAFHKQIGRNLEVYVEHLVIKIRTEDRIIKDIEETFKTLREINMKLNQKKLYLRARRSTKGIKVCPDKVDAILSLPSLKCLKDVQKLNGKMASLNRFLAKSAEKSLPFFKTLKKPRVSVKGQIIADFIVEPPEEDSSDTPMEVEEELLGPWILFMDGSSCANGSIAGLILTNPEGAEFTYALRFRLFANQVNETYITKETDMIRYLEKVRTLTNGFRMFSIKQVPRSENRKADAPSKIASTSFVHLTKQVLVEELKEKSINELEVLAVVEEERDTWMTPIFAYLSEETLLAEILLSYYAQGCKGIDKGMPRLAVIPAEIDMPTLRKTKVDIVQNDEALEINLNLLEERREQTAICEAKSKAKMEKYYNSKLGPKWERPYEVTEALGKGAYKLRDRDGKQLPRTWNVHNLKKCHVHEMMRTEYCLREKKRLESECESQANLFKARDAEIENMNAQLLLKETKVAEATHLRIQVSAVEVAEKLQSSVSTNDLELKDFDVIVSSLKCQNDGLMNQVHALETICFSLRDQVSGRRWLLTHGLKLIVIKCLNSPGYLTALGLAISHAIEKGMKSGLSAGIDHEKAGRSLADVVAYNLIAKADYNSALQRFREVDFSLLSDLSSHKDASVEDIMNLLRLEGPLTDLLE
nr:reverse transcriptase domain-containing protein [Tanacetum cinerariifolium]